MLCCNGERKINEGKEDVLLMSEKGKKRECSVVFWKGRQVKLSIVLRDGKGRERNGRGNVYD